MPKFSHFVSAGGLDGVAVSAWKASRFSSDPSYDDPPPAGAADWTGGVTSSASGASGQCIIDFPTFEPYWVSSIAYGHTLWTYYDVTSASSITEGAVGPTGPQGIQGIPGANGAQGITGTAGPTGPQGPVASFRGVYGSGTTYAKNDAVSYAGTSYVSLVAANTGNQPDTSPTQWAVLAEKGDTGAIGPAGVTSLTLPILFKFADYTAVVGDHFIVGNGTSLTITLPDAGVLEDGYVIIVKNLDPSSLTVAAAANNIDLTPTVTLAQNDVIRLVYKNSMNWVSF